MLCSQNETEQNGANLINKDIYVKYQRFDSFEKVDNNDNKMHFKSRFILLNYYLSKTELFIEANIIANSLNVLKLLFTDNKTINCKKYVNSLKTFNEGGHMTNPQCSFDINKNEK